MQQLHPVSRQPVDSDDIYDVPRQAPPDRPYVFLNMIASVDGATAVGGVTRELGSEADRKLFLYLRTLADVILVGAQTVRAEGYGPAKIREPDRQRRVSRKQAEVPPIAVISGSLNLDWSSRFFSEGPRPIVMAPSGADRARLEAAAEVADVITTPGERVDLTAALQALRARGVALVLCEGGPDLNAQLLENDLVDELCLTVAPTLVGGHARSIIGEASLPQLRSMQLSSVLEDDGFLYLRYVLP